MVTFSSRHFALGEFYKWIHLTVVSRKVLLEKGSPFFFFFFFSFLSTFKVSGQDHPHVSRKKNFLHGPHDSFSSQEGLVPPSWLLYSSYFCLNACTLFSAEKYHLQGSISSLLTRFWYPQSPLSPVCFRYFRTYCRIICGEFLSPLFKVINCS